MKIKLVTIYVDDQERAARFYTDVLGFVTRADVSNYGYRWLTVGAPDDPDGAELQLALNADPAAQAFQAANFASGNAATMFQSSDIQADVERIKAAGGEFTIEPMKVTGSTIAMVNDTCGNLIQIVQMDRD